MSAHSGEKSSGDLQESLAVGKLEVD